MFAVGVAIGLNAPRHIIHASMEARRQPLFEQGRLGRQVGVGDAHFLKAERYSPILYVGCEGS